MEKANMKNLLTPDAKSLALKSYTAWAFYGLVAVTIAPDLLYKIFEVDTNPIIWGRLQLLLCVFGLIGRLLLQPERNKWIRRSIVAAIIFVVSALSIPAMAQSDHSCEQSFDSIAFDLVSRWEGKENRSYQDIVGVWTICYGHTKTAAPNQYKTDDECRLMLVEEIDEYRAGLHVYFNDTTKRYRLTNHRDAAYTSLAYNVGIRAAGRSTATRRLNAGNIKGGCEALTWWNKAGGRVVRGLVRRRSSEKELCLKV